MLIIRDKAELKKTINIQGANHMEKMNAIVIANYGGPEVMELKKVDIPVPQSGQVLVKTKYATVIPLDFKIRNGWLKAVFPTTFPYIPGNSMAGEIVSVGADVTDFQSGDRVFGIVNGSYAEYSVAATNQLVKMPEHLSFEDAATIKGGAESAWKALFTEGNLEKGQKVLIHAAAGGVGQYAVQLAKWKGATVIGTASNHNIEFIKELGVDHAIDYTTTSFEKEIDKVDLVIDLVGGETENKSWSLLKDQGILVSLVNQPSQQNAALHNVTAKFNTQNPTQADLETITHLIANKTLTTEIDSIFDLEDASEALQRSESRRGRGRILLKI